MVCYEAGPVKRSAWRIKIRMSGFDRDTSALRADICNDCIFRWCVFLFLRENSHRKTLSVSNVTTYFFSTPF